ncbi:MAG: LmeA family phospholipid-binding protein, partial [Acidimicrobiales bacterium]
MRRDYPRVPGPGRAILYTLLVVLALSVGADTALRAYVEGRLAGAVQASLALPARPDLDLEGFPFSLSFFRGRFDHVEVAVSDVELESLRLDRVVLRFADVRFVPQQVLSGAARIDARGGTGQAEVGE